MLHIYVCISCHVSSLHWSLNPNLCNRFAKLCYNVPAHCWCMLFNVHMPTPATQVPSILVECEFTQIMVPRWCFTDLHCINTDTLWPTSNRTQLNTHRWGRACELFTHTHVFATNIHFGLCLLDSTCSTLWVCTVHAKPFNRMCMDSGSIQNYNWKWNREKGQVLQPFHRRKSDKENRFTLKMYSTLFLNLLRFGEIRFFFLFETKIKCQRRSHCQISMSRKTNCILI